MLEGAARAMIALAVALGLVGALALLADKMASAKRAPPPILAEIESHGSGLRSTAYRADPAELERSGVNLAVFIGQNTETWKQHPPCYRAAAALYAASVELRRLETRAKGHEELEKFEAALSQCHASIAR